MAHHKQVDDQPKTYTVARLKEMKHAHEAWVREKLEGFDSLRQRDHELYAAYTEQWLKRAGVNKWPVWSLKLLAEQPAMLKKRHERLYSLTQWLYKRIWPGRYPEFEGAYENFRRILQDLLCTFDKYADEFGKSSLVTKKLHHNLPWNLKLYNQRLREYTEHVDLLGDLMLELTRSANYICDCVRKFVDPSFRLSDGVILAESGPHPPDMRYSFLRAQYKAEERIGTPYPGLKDFRTARLNRDICFAKLPIDGDENEDSRDINEDLAESGSK